MRRRVVVAVLVAVVVVAGYVVWKEHTRELKRLAKVPIDVSVDLSAEKIELRQGEDGKPKWLLTAKSAQYERDNGQVLVASPVIRYYMGPERGEMVVQAAQGEISQQDDTARLWPDVQGSMDPYSLRSDEVRYLGKAKQLEFLGNVHLVRESGELTTARVIVDLQTKNVTALGGVTATFPLESMTAADAKKKG
jgi:lipopolysaccharide export system protein LptC